MKPKDRENKRYLSGSDNSIDVEEMVMFSLLPKSKQAKLLDIGCGMGTISLKLQKKGFQVYGIDFSSAAVRKTREKGIIAMECDVDEDGIPFEDNYFDIVWVGDILEHVFDPIFLLKEISRVAKPGAKILLTTPNDFNFKKRISIFISGKSPQSNIYRELHQCKHHTMFSLDLLEYMLRQGGLNSYFVHSIIKIPGFKKEKHIKNKTLSALLGSVFIIEAYAK